ncbi:hypothetical protein CYMTET_4468 [Cymbomonas tetramitiformis]|uniref:Uncharacterized protein n=1 Tax=Cymbomonas tetramitiformis TaxID=36881 RepID=A0AAE0H1B7_9CHLO|nr:hypothetical protein CYMTET_4468 [Cymbomonas tetramitiformis]
MATHFNHSVIGRHVLHDCRAKYELTSPPQDNDTRGGWKGAFHLTRWYMENQESVQLYDVEHPKKAATVVANPDGSKYGDHQLCGKDWDVVRESTYILSQHATVIDLLQVTSEPTVSQVLPMIGGLIRKLEPGHTLKYGGASVYILNTDVQDARKRFANDLIKRFFNDLMVCKLEDWCVSTLLDPRYKMLQFKNLERWERGTLAKFPVITWAKRAYAADWEPVASEETSAVATPAIREEQSKLVSFLEDSDEEDEVATGRETPALASEAPTAALVEEDEFALYLALPPASMIENPIACCHSLKLSETTEAREKLKTEVAAFELAREQADVRAVSESIRPGLS